uniref:Ig-like domain-containing protein n=1 Tax=Fundulus heteroclitus TaxID=8078 RepID=A0A3Q2NXD2_FUNHE
MLSSQKFFFCLLKTHLRMSSLLNQDIGFLSAHVGDKVTLQCSHEGDDVAWICWYMQTLGQKPKLISSSFLYGTEVTFYDEFKNNVHYIPDRKEQTHYLTILNLKMSDSATYYCAISYKQIVKFVNGTTVSVKGSGSNIQASIHQLESETVQAGDSVTLNCTVQIGSCDEEHEVYWFRNIEESQPGLIYTHGYRKDQCMRNPNTTSKICVHNLSMKNLNESHTGTYYCAVASCGHVVFGNGTMLNLSCDMTKFLVYFLAGSSTTLLLVLLIAFGYKLSKKYYQTAGNVRNNTDGLHYASINVNHSNRSQRQRSSKETECFYSSISQNK